MLSVLVIAGFFWVRGDGGGAGDNHETPAGTVAFKPGKWEITVTLPGKVAPGQPAGPFVDQQCLEADSPTPRGHVPPGCRSLELKQEGAEIRWRLRCMGARQGDGTGHITLADGGARLEGTLLVWLPSLVNGTPQRHDQKLSGRWLGPCDPPAP